MAFIIIGIWMAFLAVLVKVGVLKKWALWMKLSPVLIYAGYFLIIAIPMNFKAPKDAAVAYRNSVQISPAVSGMVESVSVVSGVPIPEGNVLFRIDAAPFAAAVDGLEAQLELARTRLDQARELAEDQAGSVYEVQQYDAQVRQLEAQLASARWNLEQTSVRAPTDGFVPNYSLQVGTQVNPQKPVMTFIDVSDVSIGAQINQNYIRHIKPRQKAEAVLKLYPGKVLPATVKRVLTAAPSGQLSPSGLAMDAADISEMAFVVELELDSDLNMAKLPSITLTGAGGLASNGLNDLLGQGPGFFSLGANFFQPIYQGGAIEAQIDIETAQQETALAAYGQKALVAFGEVESALNNEHLLSERETVQTLAVGDSAEAAKLAQRQFEVGKITMLNVLQIQSREVASRSTLIRLQNARLTQRINLHLAIGGSFEETPRRKDK